MLASLLLAVALPVTLLVLRFDPRDHGLVPDGREVARRDNPLLAEADQMRHWRSRDVLRSPSFWLLAAAFGIILFCQQSVLIHQVALLQERTGSAQAVTLTA